METPEVRGVLKERLPTESPALAAVERRFARFLGAPCVVRH